ncbi:MAG TPA: hypothetical protein VN829_17435, partial [Dongiaceae bacterium]|nr:hypothetical protein [Dongiaceae bacterium]
MDPPCLGRTLEGAKKQIWRLGGVWRGEVEPGFEPGKFLLSGGFFASNSSLGQRLQLFQQGPRFCSGRFQIRFHAAMISSWRLFFREQVIQVPFGKAAGEAFL